VTAGHSQILAFDDNGAGQMLVRAVLELAGLRIDTSGSAEDVLNRLSAAATDVMDLPGVRTRGPASRRPASINLDHALNV
jgi:CheY-like chemotaxis protein